jgi:Ca2+-binding RTX toxin-like protein
MCDAGVGSNLTKTTQHNDVLLGGDGDDVLQGAPGLDALDSGPETMSSSRISPHKMDSPHRQ